VVDWWLPSLVNLTKVGTGAKKIISSSGMAYSGDGVSSYFTKSVSPNVNLDAGITLIAAICGTATTTGIGGLTYSNNANNSPAITISCQNLTTKIVQVFARPDNNSGYNTQLPSSVPVFDGLPHVVVLRASKNGYSLYVDGVFQAQTAIAMTGAWTLNTFSIGAFVRTAVGNYSDAPINCSILLNRSISDVEAVSLKDPVDVWSIFAPPITIPFIS
jgi:hypothetical protein